MCGISGAKKIGARRDATQYRDDWPGGKGGERVTHARTSSKHSVVGIRFRSKKSYLGSRAGL